MCLWDSMTWVPLLQKVPGSDAQVSQKQLVPGTNKWFPQEQNILLSTEERQDSKIPLIRLAWDSAGAKLLNILDYQMVHVVLAGNLFVTARILGPYN